MIACFLGDRERGAPDRVCDIDVNASGATGGAEKRPDDGYVALLGCDEEGRFSVVVGGVEVDVMGCGEKGGDDVVVAKPCSDVERRSPVIVSCVEVDVDVDVFGRVFSRVCVRVCGCGEKGGDDGVVVVDGCGVERGLSVIVSWIDVDVGDGEESGYDRVMAVCSGEVETRCPAPYGHVGVCASFCEEPLYDGEVAVPTGGGEGRIVCVCVWDWGGGDVVDVEGGGRGGEEFSDVVCTSGVAESHKCVYCTLHGRGGG